MAKTKKGYGITEEQMLDAIQNSGGIFTTIAAHLVPLCGRKPDWNTVRDYVNKWESTKQAVENEKEKNLDIAENCILQEIYKNNAEMSKWYLRMKGKERGYVETQEILNKNPDPLNINLTGDTMSAKDLEESPDIEVTGGDDK